MVVVAMLCTHGLRQWAAVSTCWLVMRVPPQYCVLPCRRSRAAIHGQSLGSAGFPPTMRLKSDFLVLTPHPAKNREAAFMVEAKGMTNGNLELLYT